MKLYEIELEIEKALEELFSIVDPETGEIVADDSEINARLDALNYEREKKILNIALWVKNIEAEAAAIREEEKKLAARRKTLENKSESIRRWMSERITGEKYTDSRVAISWRKSETVEVNGSAELLPARFQRVKIDIAKDEIKKALKAGESFDFAKLIEKQNLQIK